MRKPFSSRYYVTTRDIGYLYVSFSGWDKISTTKFNNFYLRRGIRIGLDSCRKFYTTVTEITKVPTGHSSTSICVVSLVQWLLTLPKTTMKGVPKVTTLPFVLFLHFEKLPNKIQTQRKQSNFCLVCFTKDYGVPFSRSQLF